MDLGNLFWIITCEEGTKDGMILNIESERKNHTKLEHIHGIKEFFNQHKIEQPKEENILEYLKTLADLGYVAIMNMGRIKNYYGAVFYLPSLMTKGQIQTLEQYEEIIDKCFEHNSKFFKVRSKNGDYQELTTIESDAFEVLKQEIEKNKATLYQRRI
jgi:hypothetical protein